MRSIWRWSGLVVLHHLWVICTLCDSLNSVEYKHRDYFWCSSCLWILMAAQELALWLLSLPAWTVYYHPWSNTGKEDVVALWRIQKCSHPWISSWGFPWWRPPWSWTGAPCHQHHSVWHSGSASGTCSPVEGGHKQGKGCLCLFMFMFVYVYALTTEFRKS